MASTKLIWCAMNGSVKKAKKFIKAGADIYYDDNKALRLAIQGKHYEMIKLLVNNREEGHENYDSEILCAAICSNNLKIIVIINDKVMKISNLTVRYEMENIIYTNYDLPVLKYLISNGLRLDLIGHEMLCQFTRHNGMTDQIKELLNAGVDVNGNHGEPILTAFHCYSHKAIKVLLEYKPNLNNTRLLHLITDSSNVWYMIKNEIGFECLLSAGLNIHAHDNHRFRLIINDINTNGYLINELVRLQWLLEFFVDNTAPVNDIPWHKLEDSTKCRLLMHFKLEQIRDSQLKGLWYWTNWKLKKIVKRVVDRARYHLSRPPSGPWPKGNHMTRSSVTLWLMDGGPQFAREYWVDLRNLWNIDLGPLPEIFVESNTVCRSI